MDVGTRVDELGGGVVAKGAAVRLMMINPMTSDPGRTGGSL